MNQEISLFDNAHWKRGLNLEKKHKFVHRGILELSYAGSSYKRKSGCLQLSANRHAEKEIATMFTPLLS